MQKDLLASGLSYSKLGGPEWCIGTRDFYNPEGSGRGKGERLEVA